MRPTAKQVWAAIAGLVLVHNVTAEDGNLLSEQMDDWIIAHPILARAVIVILAVHLANMVTPQYDVISWGFIAVRKIRRPNTAAVSPALRSAQVPA